MNRNYTSPILPISILLIALWILHHFASAPPRVSFSSPVPKPSAGQISSSSSQVLPLETSPLTFRQESVQPDPTNNEAAALPPQLQNFTDLNRKAFRSNAEKAEFKRLIRSHAVLREAFALVDAPTESVRTAALALIESALEDHDNPETQYVVDEVERILFADNLKHDVAPKIRRSRAADKGELMLSYIGTYPDRIERLLSSTNGTSNQKLVENVLQVGERRRQNSVRIIKQLDEGT
jgi:hypothetical protein